MKTGITIKGIKYYTNKEKGTVICVMTLKHLSGSTFSIKGIATCSTTDTFDETKGRRIAESRAKYKMFRGLARGHNERINLIMPILKSHKDQANFCMALAERELQRIEKLCEE